MIRPALDRIGPLLLVAGLGAIPPSPSRAAPSPDSLSPGVDSGPSLLWPTDAGRCVTGSFCEFRPDHFHSGLDISTWGKTGYRCFAVGDGEIVRARVSCGGYGRAVYLRLEDGRTAVYAHLSRFAGSLGDSVRARQERRGAAYLDATFAPGTFPVRRGEIVAYTGQSGTGVAHLHFELRDESERPLDPLSEGLAVRDSTPPVVTRLALTPLTPASSADGRSDTVILEVHPVGESPDGRIPRVLPVEGDLGISVEVDETTDACRFRLAPRRMELREGEGVLFVVEYGAFSFSQTRGMDLQIDPRFSYPDVGDFHHLWRRAGNELPFSPGSRPGDGVIRAGQIPEEGRGRLPLLGSIQGPGEVRRRLEIVVSDAAGNRSSTRLTVSFAAPPEVPVLSARLARTAAAAFRDEADLSRAWADTLEVHGGVRAGGRDLDEIRLEFSFDGGRTWIGGPSVIPGPDLSFHARFPVQRRIPGEGSRGVIVRARAIDVLGAAGLPKTVAVEGFPPPPPRVPEFEIVTLGPWFEIRFGEDTPWSALSGGRESAGEVLVRSRGRGTRIVASLRGPAGSVVRWTGTGKAWKGFDPWGRPVALRFEIPPAVSPSPEATVASPAGFPSVSLESRGGLARYRFAPGAVPETVFALIREEPPPRPGPGLRALTPLHFLDTGQVPLTGTYEVTLRPKDGLEFDPDRLGIFVQEADDLRYIETARDDRGWVAETRTFLGIGLFEDATPPVLGEPRLEERHGRTRLQFRAEDDGAGIDCDDVEVLLDGRPVLHELDDETGDVVAYPPLPAVSGTGGVFELRAVDRCGNASRRVDEVSFP